MPKDAHPVTYTCFMRESNVPVVIFISGSNAKPNFVILDIIQDKVKIQDQVEEHRKFMDELMNQINTHTNP